MLNNKHDLVDAGMTVWDFLLRCAGWVLVFLAPTDKATVGLFFLVGMNFATGVWRSKKAEQRKFEALGFWKSVAKAIAYQFAIVTTYTVEAVFMPGVPLTRAVAGLLAVRELRSSLENLGTITGVDIWQRLAEFFKKPPPPPSNKP